jgi:topoisomerase-4 subunit B
MHIRLLLITFFVQFFPDLIRDGHVFILQTPLFRVRNKKETRYCYSEMEKQQAMHELRPNPDIVRFKGLGEISPHEMKDFINENIRLDPVELPPHTKTINDLLEFYMGKNTEDRQRFIIQNLRVETDYVAPEDLEAEVEAVPAELA